MSIQSSTFGPVRLSGEDAEKFVRQVKFGRVSKRAVESARRGRELADEFAEKGYVTLGFSGRDAGQ